MAMSDLVESTRDRVGLRAEGIVDGVRIVVTVKLETSVQFNMVFPSKVFDTWVVCVDAPDHHLSMHAAREVSFVSKEAAIAEFNALVERHGLNGVAP